MSKPSDRFGQWIGTARGEKGNANVAILNIERRSPDRAQILSITPDSQWRTSADATVHVVGDKTTGEISNYKIFDHERDWMISAEQFWQEHAERLKDAPPLPTSAQYESHTDGNRTWGSYRYNTGLTGTFELLRKIHEGPRKTVGPLRWEDFKQEIARFRGRPSVLFRGQDSNKLPLQTLFHRCGRNDMVRYVEDDMVRLRHQINAVSKHYYQQRGEDFLALLSLAQHHGYPTPLLDWSRSPYVAAFFAFDCLADCECWDDARIDPIRVFAFDYEFWPKPSVNSLKDPMLSLQFVEPPAHNNPRFVPQQSVALYSNVDNIEAFVSFQETRDQRNYLTAFDIRPEDREVAIEDLQSMGITASALFPGFEGICRSLRLQAFR